MNTKPPVELGPDEDLSRGVFSKRSRNRARKGDIDFKVFLESEQAKSVSVDRMDHASIDELAEWSRERACKRGADRHFYGWAVLKVRDAEQNERTVVATPTRKNRCHADIYLNVTEEEKRGSRGSRNSTPWSWRRTPGGWNLPSE